MEAQRKYAVFKAKYIRECLREGRVPVAGPLDESGQPLADSLGFDDDDATAQPGPAAPPGPVTPPQPRAPASQPLPPPAANPPPQPRPAPASAPATHPSVFAAAAAPASTPLSNTEIDVLEKASKHCKFALSALQYSDIPTAVQNLQDALRLLTK